MQVVVQHLKGKKNDTSLSLQNRLNKFCLYVTEFSMTPVFFAYFKKSY